MDYIYIAKLTNYISTFWLEVWNYNKPTITYQNSVKEITFLVYFEK